MTAAAEGLDGRDAVVELVCDDDVVAVVAAVEANGACGVLIVLEGDDDRGVGVEAGALILLVPHAGPSGLLVAVEDPLDDCRILGSLPWWWWWWRPLRRPATGGGGRPGWEHRENLTNLTWKPKRASKFCARTEAEEPPCAKPQGGGRIKRGGEEGGAWPACLMWPCGK